MPLEFRSNKEVWVAALAKLNPKIASIPNSNTGYSPFLSTFLEWVINLLIQINTKRIHSLRTPKLPHPTYQPKIAWSNMSELIRHNSKLKELILKTIEDPECLDPSIFNVQKIRKMFEAHVTGKENYMDFLFLLLTFGRWHKIFGPHAKHYGAN